MQSVIPLNKYLSICMGANKIEIYILGEKYRDYSFSKINEIIQNAKFLNQVIINKDIIQNILKTNPDNGDLLLSFYKLLTFWIKNKYNTTLLDYHISFPLLDELVKVGDHHAKKVFYEEILRFIWSGDYNVRKFIQRNNYYDIVSLEAYKRRVNTGTNYKDVKFTLLLFTILTVWFIITSTYSLSEIFALNGPKIVNNLELWRLFTSIFTHQYRYVLIVNLSLILIFGCLFELNNIFSHWTYIIIFILSGFIGNIAQLALTTNNPYYIAGASGGVFGIMGGFTIILIDKKRYLGVFYVIIFTTLLLITSTYTGIAFNAHFYGFLSGLAFNSFLYILREILN